MKSEFFFVKLKKLPAEGEKSEAVVEVGLEDAKVDACDLRCWWLEKLCSRAEKQNKIVVVIVVRDQKSALCLQFQDN